MTLTADQLIESGLRHGMVDAETLGRLRLEARRQRADLMETVAAHYRFPVSALYRALAEDREFEFVDPLAFTPPRELVKKIPHALLHRKQVLPLIDDGQWVTVAVSDPDDRTTLDTLQRLLGRQSRFVMSDPASLKAAISRALAEERESAPGIPSPDVDLVELLNDILRESYLLRASDIHLTTEKYGLRVRMRVDGRLRDYHADADAEAAAGLISRVKVLSNLDIAEQREPQDGGFTYGMPAPINQEFNIRVATAPTRLGERVTMRLLGQETKGLTLTQLGMSENDLVQFRKAIRKPFGMILLTGPTGSGKSTTLQAALQEINAPDINIMTVENPIEYVMEGISQIQTGAKITFADALRSLLRHDPDVLMVGEIRDHETADVAVKAAMTGHLLFSTLHTNTAVGAVTRLKDIGCEPFLVGSTLNAVIAQRLVRRLCPHCRKPRQANAEEAFLLGGENITLYEPKGCALCQGVGYRGRLGLFETLWIDEELGRAISRDSSEEQLEKMSGERLKTMWADGREKVLAGMTTLSEVLEVAVPKVDS
jgi:type IV pilus assembly protein PilB